VFSSGDISCSRRTLLCAADGAHNVKTQNPFPEEPQNARYGCQMSGAGNLEEITLLKLKPTE